METIISLCDESGIWSAPYLEAGYRVVQVDPKLKPSKQGNLVHLSMTVQQFLQWLPTFENVVGILMAPPCDHFTNACSRLWSEKDADGRTEDALEIVDACITVKDYYEARGSLRWWALENPVGRLSGLRPFTLGLHQMVFHPCDYAGFAPEPDAERYTKRTCLWGNFDRVLPESYRIPTKGSISEFRRCKVKRSRTPLGFAQAFFAVNQ